VERLNINMKQLNKRGKNMKKVLLLIMILFCFNVIYPEDKKCTKDLTECRTKCDENTTIECILICYINYNNCIRD
jgi:hypothetical protein